MRESVWKDEIQASQRQSERASAVNTLVILEKASPPCGGSILGQGLAEQGVCGVWKGSGQGCGGALESNRHTPSKERSCADLLGLGDQRTG